MQAAPGYALRGSQSSASEEIEFTEEFGLDWARALGKDVNYTLSLWQKLTRFLDHPETELSSNLAEYSMRPVVLGRKYWIHVGSEEAVPNVAAILSVFETCPRLKVPLREYLADVLPRLRAPPFSGSENSRRLPGLRHGVN